MIGRPRSPTPLGILCACLTAGVSGCRAGLDTAAALADPHIDHVALAALSGRNLVTPALAGFVAAEPELARRLPEDFATYLEVIRSGNAQRNRILLAELVTATGFLNGIGIEPVLLKGTIRLVDGLYPDPGWRFLRDLDLLVPRHRLSEVAACLRGSGYVCQDIDGRWPEHHHQLPPMWRPGAAATLDLHGDLLPRHKQFCLADSILESSRPLTLDGVRVRVPQGVDQLAHLIGHDRCETASGLFLLRNVLETALLGRDAESVELVVRRADKLGIGHWARSQLGLASRLFPGLVAALPVERRLCRHLWLRSQMAYDRRLRRFVSFARAQVMPLLLSPEARAARAEAISSPGGYRRGAEMLHRLWLGT